MKSFSWKKAGRVAVLLVVANSVVACALLGGGNSPEAKVHHIMHGLDEAHMKSASQELPQARKAARQVGEYAKQLQEDGVRFDDGEFLRYARDLEDANARLQTALGTPPKFADIPPAFYDQIKSCADCHRVYR
jgi:hypothetical protein